MDQTIQKNDELWAITKDALAQRMDANAGGSTVAHGVKSKDGRGSGVFNENGISIVPINGDLVKKAEWSGDTAYQDIADAIFIAKTDPTTKAILLRISSPGGMVSGCPELADYIADAGKSKPVYAYADGLMASAAYWLGSSAKEVAASKTAQVGSIGVLTAHTDISKMLENIGVKVTFITSGKYKAIGNFAEPLSDEGRGYIQNRIDKVYSMFVGDVARNRWLSTDAAETWADGQIFFAEDALKAGLIDRVCSIEAFINHITGEHPMKAEDVRAQHPDVYDAIFESGAKSVRGTADAEKKEAVDTAVAERTTEILALVGAVTGQDASAKLAAMIEAGVTAKQLEAMKSAGVLGAGHYDFTSRQQILDGLNAAQSQAVGQAAGDGKAGNPAVEFDARVDDYMRVNGVKRGEAMDKVGAEHPKLREAWLKSKQAE